MNISYIRAVIRICQLSSLATRRLSSAKAFRQTPEEWAETVIELNEKLRDLKRVLKEHLNFELPFNLAAVPSELTSHQAISLQFLYYALVWDIHCALAHPWSRGVLGVEGQMAFQSQIRESSAIVVETTRMAVLDCRFIEIDGKCPLP